MSALLEVEQLEVSFGRVSAVRGASLTVERGVARRVRSSPPWAPTEWVFETPVLRWAP